MEFKPLPFASIAIRVPDVEAARARLEESGIEFGRATFDSGVCNGAIFTDTDGNGLMIHRRYAPYRDGTTP
jgi:predicted enzyme related to lactoylglutathione lyase